MTDLLERPRNRRRTPSRAPRRPRPVREDRLNRRGSLESREPGRPRASLVVALVLTCLSLMAADQIPVGSPVDPLRRVVGEVLGPLEAGVSSLVRPLAELPGRVSGSGSARAEVRRLQAENDELRAGLSTSAYDRNRLREYDDLTAAAGSLGYALVPARVVGIGPAQSFSDTVTIDAGSRSGLAPDMTVISGAGLVGRILRVTSSTATVLLVADPDSTVGGRVGRSMKVGFLHGRGEVGQGAGLDLDLVDQTYVPTPGETVVTWGSQDGAPYVSGVPVGTVRSVYSSLRETTQRAVIDPFVDFSALDVVGVVVPSGTRSDRGVIEVDGTMR